MLNLPSTTVRSKYLRTLPINTVYLDPKNGHKYQVVERRVGSVLCLKHRLITLIMK